MKYYVMRNGQKQYINIDADDVKFEDGDSFQEKPRAIRVLTVQMVLTVSTEWTAYLPRFQ